MKRPKVTVLMTVYNGIPYLRFAIDSILAQSFSDFEFLIINDCSTDETRNVILNYDDDRIRLVDNAKNIKQTRSLNKGLSLAAGDIVVRMDADDISHPNRLEMQIQYLRRHPEVTVVGSNIRFINEIGRIMGKCSRPTGDLALRWLQLFVCPIACGAAAFRKIVVWDKLGGFDEAITVPQDWELWSRLMPENKVGSIPHFLIDVRRHSNCETTVSKAAAKEEISRINRMNPSRLLNISNNSQVWYQKVDSLRKRLLDKPEDRIEVINTFFEKFCTLYPEASRDSDVIRCLLIQYFRVLAYSRPQRLIGAIKKIKTTWPESIDKGSAIYHAIQCLPRAVEWKFH